jgi:hypothetical protein
VPLQNASATVLVALSLCLPGRTVAAQCADGSAPPCIPARTASRETARPIDRNRIAILPFRVTTSDSLLGEGFAELLASEFTGEGSPRSVDMGAVIQSWRRAGGASRSPLTREQSIQIARQLGAGFVSEGSIVGLGKQITITASLFTVPDGRAEGTTTRVTASADSLEIALRKTATALIAGLGGRIPDEDATRYTTSPEAMRSYLEGMRAWRRGLLHDASRHFERAIGKDSLFARALFRRYIAAGWGAPGPSIPLRRIWEVRDRLSRHEQLVLEGVAGPEFPKARTIEQRIADRDRVVSKLPDAPDALYFAGDMWYHAGANVDPRRNLLIARDYLEGAAAADSQATFLVHLIEIGLYLRDTALLKRVTPTYLRTDAPGRWYAAWEAAASIGDVAMLNRLRQSPDSAVSAGPGIVLGLDVPAPLLDEALDRLQTAAIPAVRAGIAEFRVMMLSARGRPAAAARSAPTGKSVSSARADEFAVALSLADAGRGFDVGTALSRLRAVTGDSAPAVRARCLVALHEAQGKPALAVDTTGFARHAPGCNSSLGIARIPADGSPASQAALAAVDSAFRERFSILATHEPYEALLLARAWERSGNIARALASIRYRQFGYGPAEVPWNYRYEGRVAALASDTAGAVRAFTRWLEIMRDAEPVWAPAQDSVRVELDRLRRRITP